MQQFGKWLQEKRNLARLTQGDLAKKAGISTSYVSTLERAAPHQTTNAPPMPTIAVVDSLARALGVPVDEARAIAGYAPNRPDTQMEIAEGVRVSLLHADKFTDEDKERFALAFKAAYEAALLIIESAKGR